MLTMTKEDMERLWTCQHEVIDMTAVNNRPAKKPSLTIRTNIEEFTPEFFDEASKAWRENKKRDGAGFKYRKKVVKDNERKDVVEDFFKRMGITTDHDLQCFLSAIENRMPYKTAKCKWNDNKFHRGKVLQRDHRNYTDYKKEFDTMGEDECLFMFKDGCYDVVKKNRVSLLSKHANPLAKVRATGWKKNTKEMVDLIQEFQVNLPEYAAKFAPPPMIQKSPELSAFGKVGQ